MFLKRYFPFDNQQKNEQMERKQLLMRKARMNADLTPVEPSEKDDADYKKLYKSIKRDYEKIQKQLQQYKQKEQNKSQAEQTIKLELDKIKNEKFSLQQETRELQNELSKVLQQVDKLSTKYELTYDELQRKTNEVKSLSATIHKLKTRLDKRNDLVKNQQGKIKNLKSKTKEPYISQINALKYANEHLQSNLAHLKNENEMYKQMVNSFDNMEPSVLLQFLYDDLTVNNLNSYKMVQALNRKYVLMRRNSIGQSGKKEIHYKLIYGHMKNRNTFIELNEREYNIKKLPEVKVNRGDPVAAIENDDGSVDIIWRFETNEHMKVDLNSVVKEKERKRKEPKESVYYEDLGDFRVLIVTANDGKKYQERLRKHQLNALWIDPFEKSSTHIRNEMGKSDFVLLCVDSMPHSVLDLIDEKEPKEKYQFLKNHNEEIVYNRIRLMVNQLVEN